MHTNVFAYTANSGKPYPEYVSINKESNGQIALIVRAPAGHGSYSEHDEGATVKVMLPHGELLKLCDAIREEIVSTIAKAPVV